MHHNALIINLVWLSKSLATRRANDDGMPQVSFSNGIFFISTSLIPGALWPALFLSLRSALLSPPNDLCSHLEVPIEPDSWSSASWLFIYSSQVTRSSALSLLWLLLSGALGYPFTWNSLLWPQFPGDVNGHLLTELQLWFNPFW